MTVTADRTATGASAARSAMTGVAAGGCAVLVGAAVVLLQGGVHQRAGRDALSGGAAGDPGATDGAAGAASGGAAVDAGAAGA